ncbi:MAG: cysteine desulfurase CsdA [Gammaproteobacteria bacterium]|uniref:Cysteine desulfurase n=1 Tax=OM182 bacterium MED-G24 TaxID=1986255 RepID=A0A2A5WRM3_9GAMM|nr:cysteine desulfurase CsdA [Gammaproteobacteria bacterium]PDH39200.1 MAG: cysteine desulfurase CsdA [OM182 bacterium MED-G24]RPG24389.1 MAG: cysteine desulfurase [Gammaproteobacteria bacterium TMED50]|tara:strand:- start:9253 stop:10488 length:1236 start_codon:yes stop_codon:yes gene_type:complete
MNAVASTLDISALRDQFPILATEINGHPLTYLDSAATTQKPDAVIDAISDYYRHDNANVHRAAHTLADRATSAFEGARKKVAAFVGSENEKQLVWTRGTTEAINLVAYAWGGRVLQEGDQILVSTLEHHSNIVPWQLVAARCGAEVVPIRITDAGEIDLEELRRLLKGPARMVAVGHVSNALGTVNPVREIAKLAHEAGALVLFDGAQATAHQVVDVRELGCDFYAFSGHKMYGPTGIGALWGREELLAEMPPWQGGGEMIDEVSFDGSTFQQIPYRFEAGTPDIAGAVGLGAAVDFLNGLDRDAIAAHENDILQYAIERGDDFDGLTRYGCASQVSGAFSFVLNGLPSADVGMLLDQQGIALRTGHHCTQPLMSRFEISGTVRASFALYNTREEVDRLFTGLAKVRTMLS